MSDVCKKPKTRPLRRQRSIYQVHYNLRPAEAAMTPMSAPNTELAAFGLQVAGHRGAAAGDKYPGLLQCGDGRILKPLLKTRTEVEFYSRLATTGDPDLLELRRFVPRYHGCRRYTYSGHEQEYIILEDLTQRMLEPCIMDVKIGRETWDHLATPEKISREQGKYRLCKQQYGFCIPGYQVFRLATGRLHRYDKEHGKRLHGDMVRSAFRNFVNCVGGVAWRSLVVSLLGALWRLQRWAGRARRLRLRAVSALLLYDAAALRRARREQPRAVPTRRKSIHSLHPSGSNLHGLLTPKGPLYPKVTAVPITPLREYHDTFGAPPPIKSAWSDALDKLNQSHSFEHNYEDKVCKIKMNYRAMLDQLASDSPGDTNSWGTVKLIDFAHAHFHDEEEATVDQNFKEGIDSLVEIFEQMLRETEDQVF